MQYSVPRRWQPISVLGFVLFFLSKDRPTRPYLQKTSCCTWQTRCGFGGGEHTRAGSAGTRTNLGGDCGLRTIYRTQIYEECCVFCTLQAYPVGGTVKHVELKSGAAITILSGWDVSKPSINPEGEFFVFSREATAAGEILIINYYKYRSNARVGGTSRHGSIKRKHAAAGTGQHGNYLATTEIHGICFP